MFCTPSLGVCSRHCSQPNLNLANLEATVAVLFPGTPCFIAHEYGILMTSNLLHYCSDGTFYNFSVTLNVKMNCARNYEHLFNFVSYA